MTNESLETENLDKYGSSIYFSYDRHYLFKILSADEFKFCINSVLEKYYKHFEQRNYSVLAKIMGLYEYNDTYIAVMKNIFDGEEMIETYDLKGSTFKREVRKIQVHLYKSFLNFVMPSGYN